MNLLNKSHHLFKRCALALLMLTCLLPVAPQADASEQQINTLLRTLKYVRGIDSNKNGVVDITILYNPDITASLNEAKATKDYISKNNILDGAKTKVTMLSGADLSSGASSDVFLVTQQMKGYYSSIREGAKKNKILTLSDDLDCAKNDCCAIAVDFSSGVKILLNQSVLDTAGFDVDSNFRYLAQRI